MDAFTIPSEKEITLAVISSEYTPSLQDFFHYEGNRLVINDSAPASLGDNLEFTWRVPPSVSVFILSFLLMNLIFTFLIHLFIFLV